MQSREAGVRSPQLAVVARRLQVRRRPARGHAGAPSLTSSRHLLTTERDVIAILPSMTSSVFVHTARSDLSCLWPVTSLFVPSAEHDVVVSLSTLLVTSLVIVDRGG